MTASPRTARPGSSVGPRWMVTATVLLAAAILLSWQSMANANQSTMTSVEEVDTA